MNPIRFSRRRVEAAAKELADAAGPFHPNRSGRPRRPVLQVIKDSPKDWFLERCSIQATVIEYVLLAGGPLIFGAPVGSMMALNYWISKIPPVANVVRSAIHGDVTYWTRPQARQDAGIAERTLPPIETAAGVKGVPPGMARLIRCADEGNRFLRPVAAFVDDWFNERARYPGFAISIAVVITGMVIFPVPWIILFPLNMVIGLAPKAFAAWLWWRNGRTRDFELRFTRPGLFQRPRIIKVLEERAEKERGPRMVRRLTGRVVRPSEFIGRKSVPAPSERPSRPRMTLMLKPRPRSPQGPGLGL